MIDWKEFNINLHVKVKLTDDGCKVLANRHNDLVNLLVNPKTGKSSMEYKSALDYKYAADENGYTKFQMWSLMEIFGSNTGMCVPNMFETNILIGHEK